MESEGIMETLLKALFLSGDKDASQLDLFQHGPDLKSMDTMWDRAVEKERASRTRFAQRAIKPR